MRILAIDPGNKESAYVAFDGTILDQGIVANEEILPILKHSGHLHDLLAVEMVACYGLAVGQEVFDTVVWIGRFIQAWEPNPWRKVYRKDVKMHLCHSMRAKDPNIRQRLIDVLGPQGTKKSPGPTYGVRSHCWAALAVAVVTADVMRGEKFLEAAT